ncbi:phage integrase [Sporolactobacillus inulinus]|uniref:Phage integrase n=1 Tax=Sporolactobacillus inulinus TaxID=2078 RepID=A0A4Y1ZHN7_9BACL|nr:tyrosine-type recombinase/integrase [Sporolactobacillus inulinus]GAY78702.1 phage integrase [Sporolactobacillus inulinus]
MKHFEQLFKKIARNHYDLVFYSPSSKYKVISNTNANKLLKKLLQELNVPPITVHGLRHTHASTLFFKEKDEKGIISVSKRLGHADKETTLRKYAHVFKEQQQRDEKMAANIFDEMLRPCVSNV